MRKAFFINLFFLALAPSAFPDTGENSVSTKFWENFQGQPAWEDLTFPSGMSIHSVRKDASDGFKFLHDCAIAEHKGALWAAWYNCSKRKSSANPTFAEAVL